MCTDPNPNPKKPKRTHLKKKKSYQCGKYASDHTYHKHYLGNNCRDYGHCPPNVRSHHHFPWCSHVICRPPHSAHSRYRRGARGHSCRGPRASRRTAAACTRRSRWAACGAAWGRPSPRPERPQRPLPPHWPHASLTCFI